MTPSQILPSLETQVGIQIRATVQSADRAEILKRWLYRPVIVALTLIVAAFILRHPLATNDGPVHVAFSHVLLTYYQADHPLQHQAYALNLRPNPNLAVYFLMSALMRFLSPALAESIIQILCTAGPVAAGHFAIRTINPRNAWLAIFILPMTLNQMFFLGLYNHAISMAAFFLVIGLYFRMIEAPSYGRAAGLSAALLLTFFCHASGFVMAYTGLGVITATAILTGLQRTLRETPSFASALVLTLKKQRYILAPLIAPIPVAAFFLSSGGKSPTAFGIPVSYRLAQFLKLHLLAVNYPLVDRYPAFAISLLLLTAFCIVSFRIVGRHSACSPQRRDQVLGAIAATLFAVFVMTIFPDTMGGGWTHYRRFQVYPYFWVLLTLSFESFSTLLTECFFAVGASASVILIASTIARQNIIHRQMTPLAQVDQLIGNHCTVLPLILESHLVRDHNIPDWMDYEPYFQSSSRLELSGDRVVLFNYLARLTPYPVHFRPEIEPQANIFRWKPQRIENAIEDVDVSDFERGSRMKVDYILLWGARERRTPEMQRQIANALTRFSPIYQSNDGWVALYQRRGGQNSLCSVTTSTAAPGNSN